MQFTAPEWFLLFPAILFAGFFWRRLNLFGPLRLLAIALLVLTLTGPRISMDDDSLDLWVLLDRSESSEDLVDLGLPEWRRLLIDSKPSSRDEIMWLDYAAEIVERGKDGNRFTGSRKLTRTGLALSHVAALAEPDRPSRVLLFTDGFATEPLDRAIDQLTARGIPVDFRLIRDETLDDYRISRIELPTRAQLGEPFLLSVTARGSTDGSVPLVIRRAGQTLINTEVELVNGVGKIEFTDRLPAGGSFEYSAELLPETDAHPGNNRASRWIEIEGGPRILVVTNYLDDPMVAVLRKQEFQVDVETDSTRLQPGRLSGARAVVLNNVPAYEMPQPFLDALDFFVREQAGGLMMVGGKQSFGSGGYFQSSIDRLLPVSMELKNEHRKLAVALAIVLDRSGSMSVGVAGGQTKMDLANSGAANAIELLGQQDQVALFAVDSAPHTIFPLKQIRNDKKALIDRAMRVQSQGGGIFVYEGLKAAWDELQKAQVGTRHIILFSDAADSEEPGDYRRLLQDMEDGGATVSVIALGSKTDPDAALLEEIATLGGGRIFFTDRPVDIPTIFAQETVTIARSAFIEEPTGAQATGRWTEISPEFPEWLAEVDGYNLSYPRPDATTSLMTTDEYLSPLVAHARRGLGRTLAVGFPMGGPFSARARAWPGYGDFVQTLGRWLMGAELPPGIGLRQRLDGTRLTLDLLYDTEIWSERFAASPPQIRLIEGQRDRKAFALPWKRIEPGHFSATADLDEGAVVRGAIQVGRHAIPFGPLNVGNSVEWAFDSERLTELRAAAEQTGGRELLDLSKAWVRPPHREARSLRTGLLSALLLVILADALVTRTGWRLPQIDRLPKPARTRRTAASKAAKTTATEEAPATPTATAPATPVAPNPPPGGRRSRYQRAKDRR